MESAIEAQSFMGFEIKSSEASLARQIEKSEIVTRPTIEDTEMTLQENQQYCTSEIVSQIGKQSSSLSSELKSSENNLSAHIKTSAIDARRTIDDRLMEVKENQQDCTTKIVSQIGKQTSSLSSELKSSENNLPALIENSAIDNRRTIEDTEMALQENQQDCTTEIMSQIRQQTSSLSSELKSSETNIAAYIEKSEICTRSTIEDTEMALKENQQDCTTEIVFQIRQHTSSLSSEMKSTRRAIESLCRKTDHHIAVAKHVNVDFSNNKDSENRTSTSKDEPLTKCQDVRERLIQFYTTTKKTVSVSPLRESRDKPIWDVFVQPKLSNVTIEKDGTRKKTENPVHQYKALFYKDEKLNSRVYVQGEPGMGKTTFLTKLALDWCDAVSEHNPAYKATFSDADTLKEFQFLFQISLRDATDQRDVIEMIKTQLIDMIYTGDKREETVKLLPHILEREKYIVTMDGLNEWVDRLNKCVLPLLPKFHTQCVSVIASRPWKMADERIKDSEINSLIEIEGIIDPQDLAKKVINSLQTGNVNTHSEFIKYVKERELMHLLTSPWLHTLLVNLWMNKMALSSSLCEINCILLDILFKNAHGKKGYFQKGNSFRCLSNTRFIQRQIDIFDALANAAFNFTFSSSKSLVFTERELLNFLSEDQLEFCLHAGVLTKRYSFIVTDQDAQFSFIHETVQEFMAAFHIANSKQDFITQFRIGFKHNVLEMSQIIIYLCGLDCKTANKLIHCLVDGEFLKDISHGMRIYIKGFYNQQHFRKTAERIENVLKSKHNQMDSNARCFLLSVLFQRMIIAGCIEAKASGEKELCLNCRDFTFNTNLTESDSNALKLLLLYNRSDVRSLILESNCLQISEILAVIHKSKHSLVNVKITMTPEISKAIHHSSIQELNCIGQFDVSSCSCVLPSLSQLTYLRMEDTSFLEDIVLPDTIQQIDLSKCECSFEWLCSLLITLSSLDHPVECKLWNVVLQSSEGDESHTHASELRSEILSQNMSNIEIFVENGSKELFELLRDTSIGILNLSTADCASLASEILHTLNRLTKLFLWGIYTGRCDLKLPASLQCISLQEGVCSSEWLCSLLITLSSLDRPVECDLWHVVLQSSEETRGDESDANVSVVRSEKLSHDLSNIAISVDNGSKELFELLRDTSIGTLNLITADCASLASEILHTLNRLTRLYLWGIYTGRCDLKLPASLQCISLLEGGCSSEWLCSLLITLSSLDRPVECDLWNVVLQSSEETHGDESDANVSVVRSEIVSHDLSNIAISVDNGSKELFELLRDTSIGTLNLITADCASLASEILHTLNRLTRLYLWGIYTGRCDLKLPALLQCISLLEGGCSSEWLCSLLITLSSLGRPVECDLRNVVLQSSEETRGDESDANVSDLRSEILTHDLCNIQISVDNGRKELFELLRDTSIGILDLRTADCASLTSEILYTLNRLTKLFLAGTYTGRCDLKLPASLQCIILPKVKCAPEWLCSLLIMLSSLDRPVECELWDVVLQSSEETGGDESDANVSVVRSEILSHDLSNIVISVDNGSIELFELLRDTSIGTLNLITADCASLASEIFHTLNRLTKLYLLGTYTGRCDLKLPASLQCIILAVVKCTPEWLCSLLITLSSLDHRVKCELWDVVLQSSEEIRGDESHTYVFDLRSEILSHDMSNIEILVNKGSKELFELLRDTSIGILNLPTADCASLASEILHTLNRLTELFLWGIYTGRCDLKLPATLQCIRLQNGRCSSEWLSSLLVTLSSLNHPVQCVLFDIVLQSSEETRRYESDSHASDLRSEILSHDLSNIEIVVKNLSAELFELLRGTSIGSLMLLIVH
ncbi:uncharacterized protein LOC127861363 [Dreissena polymorpha]|uniref:NACHT domain-containing protein n=1 Tax=Dreissena polymorpha TaxID=45954 RepID=A0A9D3Y949_DREPO|nr:uncharacterized protein LOC127861363 [Dreissena polymorpha]KAH3695870.1 hypothetical protein DPMN_083328 [Dreissena polymorpha]